MPQTTLTLVQYSPAVTLPGPAERLGGFCGRLVDRALLELATMLPSPDRDRLATMNPAHLRDIGLTPDGVMDEPARPLWLG